MKKLFLRLVFIFFVFILFASVILGTGLYKNSKDLKISYLDELLISVESDIVRVNDEYTKKLQMIKDEYLNRAIIVETVLSSDSQMISQKQFDIVKELVKAKGIAVIDDQGDVCLSSGDIMDLQGDWNMWEGSDERIVVEDVAFDDIPSYFFVEVKTDSSWFYSVRLYVPVEHLKLESRQEMIKNVLEKMPVSEDTVLAAVQKEQNAMFLVSENKFEKNINDEDFLKILDAGMEQSIVPLDINGIVHTAVIKELDGLYIIAAVRSAAFWGNIESIAVRKIFQIIVASIVMIFIVRNNLKKYLFNSIAELNEKIHRILEGDYSAVGSNEEKNCVSELEQLSESVILLGTDYICKSKGITHMEDLLSAARMEARFDHLTGLYNRTGFEYCTQNYLNKDYFEGVLVLFDLDNFKCINDSEGHPEGDRILIRFAQCLRENFRKSDCIGRLGGDEFMVLMPNTVERQFLEMKFKILLKNVQKALDPYYDRFNVSVSIGAVVIDGDIRSYEKLYQCADTALYIAKYLGKNQYYINERKISCMKRECIQCLKDCPRSKILSRNTERKL